MPTSGVFEPQRALEFGRVVHLDQHRHAERKCGLRLELGHLRVVQAGGDQQDAVGAHRARLEHLVGVDDEVLAQHRQRARRARLSQIAGEPWKNCASVSTLRQAAPWRA